MFNIFTHKLDNFHSFCVLPVISKYITTPANRIQINTLKTKIINETIAGGKAQALGGSNALTNIQALCPNGHREKTAKDSLEIARSKG